MEEDNKTIIEIDDVSQLSKEEAIKLKEKGIEQVALRYKSYNDKRKREETGEEYFMARWYR